MELGDELILKDGKGNDVEFSFISPGDFEGKHYFTCTDVVEADAPFDPDVDMIIYLVEWEFDADGRPCFTLVEDDKHYERVIGLFERKRLAEIVESYACTVTATGSIDTYHLTNKATGERRISTLTHNCVTIDGADYVIFNAVPADDELNYVVFLRQKSGVPGDYDGLDEEVRAAIAERVEELLDEWSDMVRSADAEGQEAAS